MACQFVYRPGPFEGQVVIVTGGGSGRRVAHELAAPGATAAIVKTASGHS